MTADMQEMEWPQTPLDEIVTALRWDGLKWAECSYCDLKVGDIFKARRPDGELANPFTLRKNKTICAIVEEEAIPSLERGYGYAVLLSVGKFKDLIQRRLN